MTTHASYVFVTTTLFCCVNQTMGVGAETTPTTTARVDRSTSTCPMDGTVTHSSVKPSLARQARQRLLRIENRVLPPTLVSGECQQQSLPAYYWAENRELLKRFDEAKHAYNSPTEVPYRAVTLVCGTAGVGKTFLKGQVFNKDYPREATCKFDIVELYEQWASTGLVDDRPDLTCGDAVLNRLKSVKDKNRPLVREYLETLNASFIVIDSLDEIHPADCPWVLEQIEDFVFHRDRRFVHVAVFGRGPAFYDFWHERTEHRESTNIRLFLLAPPAFRTMGDLQVSSWNYHTWAFGLSWNPVGGESQSMSLSDYRRWKQRGGKIRGEFRSVTSKTDEAILAETEDVLADRVQHSRVVCSMLGNLAGNGLLRQIVQSDVEAGRGFDEGRLLRSYLDRWLIRETKSHGLPSTKNPEYLDLYLALLQEVAVKYLKEDAVDDSGFFPVQDTDVVHVNCKGHECVVPVRRILDRAGLMFIDPRAEGVARYRFEPIWFHRLLVDMHEAHETLASRETAKVSTR